MKLQDLPGELLSEKILLQELGSVGNMLRKQLGDQKVGQAPLAESGDTTIMLYWFEQGGHLLDQTHQNATVIVQIFQGVMCFQSGEIHRHPEAGSMLTIQPGQNYSLQAERTSQLLVTLIQTNDSKQ